MDIIIFVIFSIVGIGILSAIINAITGGASSSNGSSGGNDRSNASAVDMVAERRRRWEQQQRDSTESAIAHARKYREQQQGLFDTNFKRFQRKARDFSSQQPRDQINHFRKRK